jgi:hypothetical protein
LIALRNLYTNTVTSYAGLEDIFPEYFDEYMPNEMFSFSTMQGGTSQNHCLSSNKYQEWCETSSNGVALEDLLIDLSVRQEVGWGTDDADEAITEVYEYIIEASDRYVAFEEFEEEIEEEIEVSH